MSDLTKQEIFRVDDYVKVSNRLSRSEQLSALISALEHGVSVGHLEAGLIVDAIAELKEYQKEQADE